MDHVKFFLESNESVLPSFYGLYVNKFSRILRSIEKRAANVPGASVCLVFDYWTRLRFTDKAFAVSAPSAWNSLPIDIRDCSSEATFKKHLKTFLFHGAFYLY